MGVGAVGLPGLAAGWFRSGLWLALGERRGLALAGAAGQFEQAAQAFDGGLEFNDLSLEALDLRVARISWGRGRLSHTPTIPQIHANPIFFRLGSRESGKITGGNQIQILLR